ncbi:MAG: hypothetical protein KFF73_15420 [Cyclobacteriaceae bacterium]|nr:hypothetical protein [Cyclobacteriaceae bacterium]
MIKGENYLLYWLKTKKTDVRNWECTFPAGSYRIEFSDPLDGMVLNESSLVHNGGTVAFEIPGFQDDMVILN